jgi:hypothetical protein
MAVPTRVSFFATLARAAAVGGMLVSTAAAQPAEPASSPRAPRDGSWVVSVNPLGLIVGGLSGEVEHRLAGTRTVAAAATYWGAWGASYLSVDGKLRFYRRGGSTRIARESSAASFAGLSFGPMIGLQRIAYSDCVGLGESCSATGVTVGGTVDYGWRFGNEKSFAVLTGAGLKTGFGFGGLGDESGLVAPHITYPFLRLGVGYVLPTGR